MAAPPTPQPQDGPPQLGARVFLRPIGSPFPLGFAGLAIASLLLVGLEWGWLPVTEGKQVGFLVLATAVPMEGVAATYAFLGRDGAAATSMGTLSATWAAIGVTHLSTRPGSTSNALATVLLMSAGLLLTSSLTQATGKLLVAGLVGLAGVRFALTGLYEFTSVTGWRDASGAVGLAVAALAGYSVFALQLEDEQRSTRLPTLRRGRGRSALQASGLAQLKGVEHEAGVREQL